MMEHTDPTSRSASRRSRAADVSAVQPLPRQTVGVRRTLCLCCGHYADHSIPAPPPTGLRSNGDETGDRAMDLSAGRPAPDDGTAAALVVACDAVDLLPTFIMPPEFFANPPTWPKPPAVLVQPASQSPDVLVPSPQQSSTLIMPPPPLRSSTLLMPPPPQSPTLLMTPQPPSLQPTLKVSAKRGGPYVRPSSSRRGRKNRPTAPKAAAAAPKAAAAAPKAAAAAPKAAAATPKAAAAAAPPPPKPIAPDTVAHNNVDPDPFDPNAATHNGRRGLSTELLIAARDAYRSIIMDSVENPPPARTAVHETITPTTVTITTTSAGFLL